jgi:hypothetical protein
MGGRNEAPPHQKTKTMKNQNQNDPMATQDQQHQTNNVINPNALLHPQAPQAGTKTNSAVETFHASHNPSKKEEP